MVTRAVVFPPFKFFANKPTKCNGSLVPGTGKILLSSVKRFLALGYLRSIYLVILLPRLGIAILGGYLPQSLKLSSKIFFAKFGIFNVGSPNDIFKIGYSGFGDMFSKRDVNLPNIQSFRIL